MIADFRRRFLLALEPEPRTLKKRRSLITGLGAGERDVDWQTLIDEFLRAREAGGIRDSTLRSYKYDLVPWHKYCEAKGLPFVRLAKTRDVEGYLLQQKQEGKAISSRRNRAVVLQQLLKYAHRCKYIASERLYGYEIVKAEPLNVYVPTLQEVRIVYDAIARHWSEIHNRKSRYRSAKSRTFFRRRDQAIVAVQVSVGLRPGETFSLELSHYNQDERSLFVANSKTRKQRYVPVTDKLAEIIDEYLESRPVNAPTDFLFVTDRGTQLHLDSWGHQFQRYLEFARSEGHVLPRITLYSLRHVAGSAIASGSDIYHAALLLGNNARTAEKHYVKVKMEAIRKPHADNDPLVGIFRKTRTAENAKKQLAPRLV